MGESDREPPAAPDPAEVTGLLKRWTDGQADAAEALLPLVHGELRALARRYMRRERGDHTLETGALINEAYLKLVDQKRVEWRNRAHFFAIAAQTMRRILIDHARAHQVAKRGGGAPKIALDEALDAGAHRPPDLIALDDALRELAEIDATRSRLVELRFFGGLTHDEIAEVLGVSTSTVERQWRLARAWLYRALAG